MKRYDVACLGEMVADLTSLPASVSAYPAYEQNPGGGAANMGFAIARMGGKPLFIGKLGDDCIGRSLAECLKSEGVDMSGMVLDGTRRTCLAFVHIDDSGERSYSFYSHAAADLALLPSEIDREGIAASKILSIGARSISEPSIRETTSFAVSIAREHHVKIAFDPNIRLNLWCDEHTARRTILDWIPRCDYLKLSDEELLFLTDISDEDRAAEQFIGSGPELIVVTRGSRGAVAYTGDLKVSVPAFPVKAANTNGAGDSFWGGMLFRLSGRAEGPFTAEELQKLLRFSCACGALTTLRPGAGPAMPYYRDIQPFMDSFEKK